MNENKVNELFKEILTYQYIDVDKMMLKLEKLKDQISYMKLEYELFRQALLANQNNDFNTAILKGEEALGKATENSNSFLMVQINILIGVIYFNRKDYEASFDSFLAVSKYEKNPRALNNMGVILQQHGDFKEAYKYYKMAIKEIKGDDNFKFKTVIYHNLAECECEFGEFEKSKEHIANSLHNIKKLDNYDGTSYIYNLYGLIELKQKNYKKAIEYFEKGETYYKSENYIIYYLQLLRNHAKALFELGEYKKLKAMIQKIEEINISHNFEEKSENELKLLAKVYENEGNYKKANELYNEHINFINDKYVQNNKIRSENFKNKVDLFEVLRKISVLEKISKTDSLTNIDNRYSLTEYINSISNYKYNTAIILMDIDYFKEYNDFYGHAMGDKCLVKIASQLSKELDTENYQLFRYGGDEFLAILPNIHPNELMLLIERIRSSIENLKIPNSNSKTSNYITCSFGVVFAKKLSNNNFNHVFNLVDKALYEVKANGRNRVSRLRKI